MKYITFIRSNKKHMKKFTITFIASFIILYLIEYLLYHFLGVDLDTLELGWLGWLGFIITYGFKLHIFCCLIPLIITSYKCRHKKCDHKHCEKNKD